MNRTLLLSYMDDTTLLAGASLGELEKLTTEFPYCQATHLLYVKALSEQNSIHYHAQLKRTAAHVSDRSILYYLIQSNQAAPSKPLPASKKPSIESLTIEKPKVLPPVSAPSEPIKVTDTGSIDQLILRVKGLANKELPNLSDISNRLSVLQSEHLRRIDDMVKAYLTLRAITEMKPPKEEIVRVTTKKKPSLEPQDPPDHKEEVSPIKENEVLPPETSKVEQAVDPIIEEPSLSKESITKTEDKKTVLIDKFIETSPSMPKPKKDFYSPTNMAHHSTIDKDDLVSETLAEIHLKQGNLHKAIKIYQRLCLIIPEKSAYFAARIEKVKKDNNLL